MDNIKKIRAFLLFFIVSLLLYAVYYVKMKQGEIHKPSIRIDKIESGIENFHLVEQTANRIGWELWADRAEITNKEQVSDLTKPRIRVYLENMKEPIDISSDKGNLNSITKEILLTDNVIAIAGDAVIKSEQVKWNSDDEVLETDKSVHVTTKKFIVEGVGMKAYITKEYIELLSNVKGEIILDKLSPKKTP